MASNKLTYCIMKSYKGIFTKKHVGNTQIYFIPLEDKFIGLTILGEIDGMQDTWGAHQFVSAGIEWMERVIAELSQDENFEIIESAPIKLKPVSKGWLYKVTIPKKGKWLKSDFDLTFSPEYSGGDAKIFLLRGKLIFIMTDGVKEQVLKMAALKHMSKVKSMMTNKSLKLKKFMG